MHVRIRTQVLRHCARQLQTLFFPLLLFFLLLHLRSSDLSLPPSFPPLPSTQLNKEEEDDEDEIASNEKKIFPLLQSKQGPFFFPPPSSSSFSIGVRASAAQRSPGLFLSPSSSNPHPVRENQSPLPQRRLRERQKHFSPHPLMFTGAKYRKQSLCDFFSLQFFYNVKLSDAVGFSQPIIYCVQKFFFSRSLQERERGRVLVELSS